MMSTKNLVVKNQHGKCTGRT